MKFLNLVCFGLLVWSAAPVVGQSLEPDSNQDESVIRAVLEVDDGPSVTDWIKRLASEKDLPDDQFFQTHLTRLRLLREGGKPDREILGESSLLFAAATVKNRADVMRALEPYRPYAKSGCNLSLALADKLLSQGEYTEAFKHYQGLANSLYQPDLCHYRMAEICCRRGELDSAVEQFKAAKFYETQLRTSTLH